jgi:hypothetical protein
MQVLSILQGTSLESTAQAKKNDGNTLTAEEEAVARVYRRCFRICVQVRRHENLCADGRTRFAPSARSQFTSLPCTPRGLAIGLSLRACLKYVSCMSRPAHLLILAASKG